jgi:hypothetical protein
MHTKGGATVNEREKLVMMRQIAQVEFDLVADDSDDVATDVLVRWAGVSLAGADEKAGAEVVEEGTDVIALVSNLWERMVKADGVIVSAIDEQAGMDEDREYKIHYRCFDSAAMQWVKMTQEDLDVLTNKKRPKATKRRKRSGRTKSAGT